jgi:ornithine decarboxylase
MIDTPQYVFDAEVIRRSYQQICRDLDGCLIHYCLKANGEASVVQVLAAAGARFEVSSSGEFDTVVAAGVDPATVLCGLPVKPAKMVSELYERGCRYFVFDCPDEWRKLEQHAPEAIKALRLNVCHISADAADFGATAREVKEWVATGLLAKTAVSGLTFDLRRNTRAELVVAALDLCEQMLSVFPQVRSVNIGGNYRMSWEVEAEYYPTVRRRLASLRMRWPVVLLAEVGRSIVKHAGRLYSRVVLVKSRDTYDEVYLDIGVAGGVTHGPTFIRPLAPTASQSVSESWRRCQFYGNTCCHTCLFTAELNFRPRPGDVLELGGMGAYTVCKMSAFHGWPTTPIVYRSSSPNSEAGWPALATARWEV